MVSPEGSGLEATGPDTLAQGYRGTREDLPSPRVSCHCERSEAISIPLRTPMAIVASLRS